MEFLLLSKDINFSPWQTPQTLKQMQCTVTADHAALFPQH